MRHVMHSTARTALPALLLQASYQMVLCSWKCNGSHSLPASSTTPPLAVLMMTASGFISANCDSPIIPRVADVIGTCSVRKSLHCSTASRLGSLSTAVHASNAQGLCKHACSPTALYCIVRHALSVRASDCDMYLLS
jgi:hypothetical protein